MSLLEEIRGIINKEAQKPLEENAVIKVITILLFKSMSKTLGGVPYYKVLFAPQV